MFYELTKIALSALIIAAVSEFAKRSTFVAALTASLPLTSLLAFAWIYCETRSEMKIAELSLRIFWLVIPSLPFFVIMSLLLKHGAGFWISLMVSIAAAAGGGMRFCRFYCSGIRYSKHFQLFK